MLPLVKGSYDLLRKRTEERQHPYMNRNLLTSQVGSLEEPKNGIIVDISHPPEVIVGTIIENLKWSPSSRS